MKAARIPGAIVAGIAIAAACGKTESKPATSSQPPAVAADTTASASQTVYPATGLRAECSVLYHLMRAGVAPRLDTTDSAPEENVLTGKMFVVKIGQMARLEVYLYPDSMARIADAKKLNRANFVDDTMPQTIKRERTLIESANLIGLFTSLSSHQRERVGDALTAGPPQPAGRE